jgi:hypothetical protein
MKLQQLFLFWASSLCTKKKTFTPQKIDLQFLENHKTLIMVKQLLHYPTLPATATFRFTLTAARCSCPSPPLFNTGTFRR